mmetsp:Transcript_46430/g.88647  ORF Transcript_46430/g.88647 Transcript_46430/m.88647 type:complete len:274 (-) Transcript_46430:329-1150(-)
MDSRSVVLAACAGAMSILLARHVQDVYRRGSPKAVRWVRPPKPQWRPGQGAPGSATPVVTVRPKEVPGGSCYPLVISSFVPRPIALVSTVSNSGTVNLAPFSYAGAMSHDPPCIAFSVCRKPGGVKKDTLTNIEQNGEMVVHVMSEWMVEAANHSCGNFDAEDDEFILAGLTKGPSSIVRPPRCLESGVQMECKVKHSYEIKNANNVVTATMILAEVVCFHIHKNLYDDNNGKGPTTVRLDGFEPMSRLGGNTYGTTTYVYDLPRPDRPKSGR